MPSKTDQVVAGRYALDSEVGRGAMGAVWAAEDRLLKRRVAVKEIEPPPSLQPAEREAMEARVMREARAAARLAHPGAVTVFDVVEEDGRPWIVMEFVNAPTLDDIVKEKGPLTPQETARIGLEVLDVLEAAHAEGIVHRDVKPGNVMIPTEGRVKLADFGIASLQDDPKITMTGLVLGSPAYMSPEQAQSNISGPEADLWSLGATLFFAVEGEAPFDKGQAIPTLTAVIGDPTPQPKRAGALKETLMRLMEKDPKDRPTPAEVRAALVPVAGGSATSAVTVAQTRPAATKIETQPREIRLDEEPHEAPARRSSRPAVPASGSDSRWAIALLAVVALLAAIFIVPSLLDNDTTETANDPAATREEGQQGRQRAANNQDDAASGSGSVAESEVPEGYQLYESSAGWSVAVPEGWVDVGNRAGDDDGTSTDLQDPDSGSYLRVDWTTEPGDDVMESLEQQEASFASSHEGYELIQMTPTEYRDYEAGLWEFVYSDGVELHAHNFQFVVGDEYGFALNFQTHEEEWDSSGEIWQTIQTTFQPPS